jgi:hypothetical protein
MKNKVNKVFWLEVLRFGYKGVGRNKIRFFGTVATLPPG